MVSIKATLAIINAMPHVKARYSNYMGSGEFRIVPTDCENRDEEERAAYYTDDREDAIATARSLSHDAEKYRLQREVAEQPPVARCSKCGCTVFFNSNPQPRLCTGCQRYS